MTNRMNIALLAPLWKTVPPEKYGGSELVVSNLAQGLRSLGHDVCTFACGGSSVSGTLIPVIEKPMYDLVGGFDWSGVKQYEFLSFFELGKRAQDFDVIHNHMGPHPLALASWSSVPFVTTLHSSAPPDFPSLAEAFNQYPFVSISDAQRSVAPRLNYVATVHHGIDTYAFRPRIRGTGRGFLFLGTLSREKGIDIAVRTAKQLGVSLLIAGEIRAQDRPFLEKDVFPYIDGERIRFIGEVGHEEKVSLLSEADALLFPSRWNEAFGLVMVEALASGTPVVALKNGAVPEILEHGKTGLIAEDVDDFAECARRVAGISRRICLAEAKSRFDLSSMARSYAEVYQSLIDARV